MLTLCCHLTRIQTSLSWSRYNPSIPFVLKQGISREREEIETNNKRRGYDRISTLSHTKIPPRELPLVQRSADFPRSPPPHPKPVTFFTSGDLDMEDQRKSNQPKRRMIWHPKTYKNFFLPQIPPPKGLELGSVSGYTSGMFK